MICQECQHEHRDGYRVNPRTGRVEADKFWCVADYEAIAAKAAREKYTPDQREWAVGSGQ